ncbi:MAG: hypothetical protein IKE14_01500 [Loktanella sp.]|nr:hypothetical protein [Loktanella sp.]
MTKLEADLSAMGISTITLMSAAYGNTNSASARHDYDALQSARPLGSPAC